MSEVKPDIKIFVSHRIDQDSETIDNPLFVNVRCGAVYDTRENVSMLGDDTGDNISEKRESFCELTVQYWAWKNVEADYYGLCHYRRYLSFSPQKLPEDIYGAVNYNHLSDFQETLPDNNVIVEQIAKYDLLVTSPANLQHVNIKNLYQQYESHSPLRVADLEMTLEIINEIYPEYLKSAKKYLNGRLFYPCNLFIMKKELFNMYCEWMFTILSKLEDRIDTTYYSIEGKRTIGHIGERLLGVFYTYMQDNCKQYKTGIVQRTIIWDTEKVIIPKPAFSRNNIPVVLACSDFYVPYAGVALSSMLENANAQYNYDITFLHTNIQKENQQLLRALVNRYKNVSLRFVNIATQIKDFKFISNNHVSVETFYRLIAHELFSAYDKIVYLDSDIVVLKDVAELYNIDIGDNLLAATIDADHSGEYNGAIPRVKEYVDSVLQLREPHRYIQAGVMVINIIEFNKYFKSGELVSIAAKREYMYVDQDVLNMCCEGRIYFLNMAWNVMSDCAGTRVKDIIKMAPVHIYEDYMRARKQPFIIHYAGFDKPWNSPLSDMAEIFWEYARKTCFYEALILRMSANACTHASIFPRQSILIRVINVFCPKGTMRREFLKSIYFKFMKKR
jgi:lipopolysaccharide biosynthesis glycosyltransferase